MKSVKWTRQSRGGVLSQDFILSLVKIKIEDTGIYECSVKNEKGEGKASVSIVVQSKCSFFLNVYFFATCILYANKKFLLKQN